MFFRIRIYPVFRFHKYRLNRRTSTVINFLNTTNFAELGRRGKKSENFDKSFLHFGFMSIKHGANFRKIGRMIFFLNLTKPQFLNILQYFAPLRQRETHPVCLSCSAESATEAISLALLSVPHVFHLALKKVREHTKN